MTATFKNNQQAVDKYWSITAFLDIHELLYSHSSGLLLQPDKCRGSFRRQREAKAGRSWTLHVHTKVDKTEHHMAQKRNPLLQNQKDIYVSPGESTCPFFVGSESFPQSSISRFNESLSCGTCNDKLDEVTTLDVPALSAFYKVWEPLSSNHKVNIRMPINWHALIGHKDK